MKKRIISLITAVLLMFGMTGCSDDGLDKVLKYDIPDNPETLDPQQANEPISELIIGNVFCGLFSKNADGTLNNAVCESYTVSDDGLLYNFKLRGDFFWVGDEYEKQCTAQDFVFGFKRLFSPETNAPNAADYYCIKNSEKLRRGSISDFSQLGVKALGDFELEIELEYTNPRFLEMLCDAPAMPCCEEFFVKSRGKYGLSAECTPSNGAFYVRSWHFDPYAKEDVNNVILSRNYKNAKTLNVCPSGLNFFIVDESTFVSDLLNKEISCLAVSTREKSLSNGKYPCEEYPSVTCGLIFNRNYAAFQNKDFLKALSLLINREQLAAEIADFEAAEGVVSRQVKVNGESYRDVVGKRNNLVYDKKTAAEYLKNAKSAVNSSDFTGARIIVPDDFSQNAASYIMQEWQREAGFYCILERLSESEYRRRLESGEYEIALYKLTGKYDSPAAYLEQFCYNSAANYSGYSNLKYDYLLLQASTAADLADSAEFYAKAEQTLIDECGFAPIYSENIFFYRQKDVEDVYYNPLTGAIDFTQGKRK